VLIAVQCLKNKSSLFPVLLCQITVHLQESYQFFGLLLLEVLDHSIVEALLEGVLSNLEEQLVSLSDVIGEVAGIVNYNFSVE